MAPHVENRSRTALRWAIGILSAAPMLSAVGEILHGARGVPGGSMDVSATVDGELRYANTFKFAVGPILLSQLGRVEHSRSASIALVTIFAGGLARLLAWKQRGRPHPAAVTATALEIGVVPVLLVWQRRVAAQRP